MIMVQRVGSVNNAAALPKSIFFFSYTGTCQLSFVSGNSWLWESCLGWWLSGLGGSRDHAWWKRGNVGWWTCSIAAVKSSAFLNGEIWLPYFQQLLLYNWIRSINKLITFNSWLFVLYHVIIGTGQLSETVRSSDMSCLTVICWE